MKKVIVIGASGHSKVIIDIIELQKKYEIVGLVDSFKNKTHVIYNYKVLGTEKDISQLIKAHNIYGFIIAIGDNFTRMRLFKDISLHHKNIKFVTAMHPSAVIGKDVKIGAGSAIMAGVVINSDAKIGEHCIINTNSTIGHDTKIENFSSIAPGVNIGGGVSINTCSAISLGVNILESIKIGKYSVIGAGSLVNKNIKDYKIAYGLPAREIRNRKKNEKYLGMTSTEKRVEYSLELFKISNEQDKEKYTSLLQEFPNSNVYYSLQYCNHNNGSDLRYFVLTKNDQIKILMPIVFNKIKALTLDNNPIYDVCSPYGYSGPLFNNIIDQDVITFWQKIDKWYMKNNVITEFIRFNLENNQKHYSGHIIPSLTNIKGEISNFKTLWSNFKQKVRNNYRRAKKSSLTFQVYSGNISQEVLNSFYDIYMNTMERNTASEIYFYNKSYFENLIKYNPDQILIAIVYKELTPVSVELIININDTLYSYLGGTLSEHFENRPNDFLKIEILKWAIKNNKKHYILGGGRKDFDSLYKYKKAFFPKDNDVVFYTGRKIINKNMYYNLLKQNGFESTDVNNLISNSSQYFPFYNNFNRNSKVNEICIIKSKTEWEDVLKEVDNYDFYHTYDYHNLSKLKDEKAILIKYTAGDIVVALPLIIRKIGNSNYFDATSVYGYAGPLCKNIDTNFDNSSFTRALVHFFKQNNIVSVFSRINPFIENQHVVLKNIGETVKLGDIVNIDITKPIDEQRAVFSKTNKRYLNKARKCIKVKISNDENDILEFIDLYFENMKRVNAEKKYFFSKDYFFKFFKSEDFKTDLLIAKDIDSNTIISGAMMVKTKNIVQYHLSGTKTNFLHLSPIRLLIDEMRLIASQENYTYFNLGGGLGNDDDDLFRFKSSFSKNFKPFKVWKFIVNSEVYNSLVNENKAKDKDPDFFPLYRINGL